MLDAIGIGSTAATMEKMGYPNTKIHSKVFRRDTSVFPERSKQFGLGSTTAAEMVRLCEALHSKELVSPEASEAMLKHMRACDDKDKFPRFLPPGTKVAFKTGSLDATRTAAGIIECAQGPVARLRADRRERGPALGARQRRQPALRRGRPRGLRSLRPRGVAEGRSTERPTTTEARLTDGDEPKGRASWDSSTPSAGS